MRILCHFILSKHLYFYLFSSELYGNAICRTSDIISGFTKVGEKTGKHTAQYSAIASHAIFSPEHQCSIGFSLLQPWELVQEESLQNFYQMTSLECSLLYAWNIIKARIDLVGPQKIIPHNPLYTPASLRHLLPNPGSNHSFIRKCSFCRGADRFHWLKSSATCFLFSLRSTIL